MPPVAALARTAVHAWLPAGLDLDSDPAHPRGPLLAAATVQGAPDDTPPVLELFAPFSDAPAEPLARIPTSARCHRIAWGAWDPPAATQHTGVLATGMDDGAVALYDPGRLLAGHDPLLHQLASPHRSPVRGLDFSPAQKNLLATGASNGEVLIWDLTSPAAPFSPGSRSRSLDTVTSLSWNPSVVHILASSSNSGMTVVWDLKTKREITALSYTGTGATGLGPSGFGATGLGSAGFGALAGAAGMGGMGGHSVVRWHPGNPTKLVTASEDDHSPFLLLWDLRNWKEPERVLRGHDKGILALSFCPSDSDLLLSSGKDGRTLAWSLSRGEPPVAEVSPATGANWTFDASWCPANPGFISTSSLDGTLAVHPLQATNAPSPAEGDDALAADPSAANGADSFFESAIAANARNAPLVSLAVEPKWFRRPASVAWGFGGRLVSVSATEGVHIARRVTVPQVLERAEALARAERGEDEGGLARFADERAAEADGASSEGWGLLKALFHAPPGAEGQREALVDLLLGGEGDGAVDRDELRVRVDELARELGAPRPGASAGAAAAEGEEELAGVEIKKEEDAEEGAALFGAAGGGADDFLASLGSGVPPATADGPSAPVPAEAEPDVLPATFSLHAPTESEPDALLTRALVLGDFSSAVALALALERHADALLLALQSGSSDLVAVAQEAYFARAREGEGARPYLRVLQAVGASRLAHLVRDLDIADWRETFLLVLTYSGADGSFPALAAQLGARLADEYDRTHDEAWRARASVAFAAAGAAGRLAAVWAQVAREQQARALDGAAAGAAERFAARAEALQALVEKLRAFDHATGGIGAGGAGDDADELHGAYLEYAELLAGQGRADLASEYVARTPETFEPVRRERVLRAAGVRPRAQQVQAQVQVQPQRNAYGYQPAARTAASAYNPYAPQVAPAQAQYPPQHAYNPYAAAAPAPSTSHYAAPPPPPAVVPTARNPYAQAGPPAMTNPIDDPYAPNPYASPAKPPGPGAAPASASAYDPYAPQNPGVGLPAPPPIRAETPSFAKPPTAGNAAPPPPPRAKPDAGWNDAPVLPPSSTLRRHTPAPPATGPPTAPIASPFPNSGGPIGGMSTGAGAGGMPPPPPPASRTPAPPPPPPMASGPKFAPPPPGGVARPPQMQLPPQAQAQAQARRFPSPPLSPTHSQSDAQQQQRNPYAPQQQQQSLAASFGPGAGAGANGFAPPPQQQQQQQMPVPPPPRAQQPTYAAPPPPRAQQAPPPARGSVTTPPPPPPMGAGAGAGVPRPQSAGGHRLPPPPQQQQQVPLMPQPQPHGMGQFVPPPPTLGGAARPPPPPLQQGGIKSPQMGAARSPQLGGPAGGRSPQLGAGPGAGPNGFQGPPPPAPSSSIGMQRGPPPPPPSAAPQQVNGAPRPPPPAPAPAPAPRAEQPKMKYPPGDRSHIAASYQPIIDILTGELAHLRQVVPLQQGKLVAETDKRLNLLFDMLNNETLSKSSADKVLEICQAIAARDQARALDLHFALITAAPPAPDVAPFQAALKLLVQRMQPAQ